MIYKIFTKGSHCIPLSQQKSLQVIYILCRENTQQQRTYQRRYGQKSAKAALSFAFDLPGILDRISHKHTSSPIHTLPNGGLCLTKGEKVHIIRKNKRTDDVL
jgi:hypothetical protein